MGLWEGYVTAGLKKGAFINSLSKAVEQFFGLCDQASWSGPHRCHAVMQALGTKSKSPPSKMHQGGGTFKFNIV
jgi:hypothetical protein